MSRFFSRNMHELVDDSGGAGMWGVHFRIGGSLGSRMQDENCPRGDGTDAPAAECTGVYLLMHVTSAASIYMEDIWGWVADHGMTCYVDFIDD